MRDKHFLLANSDHKLQICLTYVQCLNMPNMPNVYLTCCQVAFKAYVITFPHPAMFVVVFFAEIPFPETIILLSVSALV